MAKKSPTPTGSRDSELLQAARRHILQLWNEQHDARLVYHNFAQAAAAARLAGDIAEAEGLPEASGEIARLAAWFFNAGYLYDRRQVAETSAIRAEFFLAEQHCAPEKIQAVRQCIVSALTEPRPHTAEARVLNDAIRAFDWAETFDERVPLLRLEREYLDQEALSESAWQQFLREQLGRGQFFTAYAKTAFEPALIAHILQLHTQQAATTLPKQETTASSKTAETGRFARLARRPLRSSIQTYFRANYANHIRLSAIADNKAHIMISVNSILLSVAISMLTYQTATSRNPLFILPIIIFLVTGLTSLIFAVLSSRPRVTSFVHLPDQRVNPVFFGNFVHLSLEEYEAAVDAMLRDGSLLFGNMTRDLYYLGQVLDKKYRLLTFSYTVFMMGFVATVGAFVGAYFL